MYEPLKDFMVKLASDVNVLTDFIKDPEKVIEGEALSEEERNILRSGNPARIFEALSEPAVLSPSPAPAPQSQPPTPQYLQPATAASWPQQAGAWFQPQPCIWPAAYAAYAFPAAIQPSPWPQGAYSFGMPWGGR